MIEITDRVVDDTYRRGIAALVAERPRRATEARHRRVPILVATAGSAIPLAALVVAAFVVIAGHTQHSGARGVPTAPATASRPASITAVVGQTIHITERNGVGVDVTLEKLVFASGARAFEPPPKYGLYAVADVLVSTPAAGAFQPFVAEYIDETSVLSKLLAQLTVAIVNKDEARIRVLQPLISSAKSKLAQLLVEKNSEPINLEYVTSGGQVYPAWDGNSASSAFASKTYLGSSPAGVADNGRTSVTVVFDVPSRGGVIQMTDSLGKVIGRWLVPAT
jgi:hypothetical protein